MKKIFISISYNNAVNVLNSIFSAVMGIAYPLIIQAIERLDKKYDSPGIAKMFKEEPAFKTGDATCIKLSGRGSLRAILQSVAQGMEKSPLV